MHTPPTAGELEQFRDALDLAAIVAITDVPGRITYANEKFCEISKYRRDELIGQDHRILNSGYHAKSFMRELWRTIAHGKVWRGELRNRAKDGSIYWVDTTIVPFLDGHGKPWQYLAIRYDITERKRNEETLQTQAALASLGQMAAVVAHEVKNPLAGIRGGAQLIRSLVPQQSDAAEIAGDILGRVDALNAVIEDLLLYARDRTLKRASIDIAQLLTDLVASARQDPTAPGVTFEVDAAQDLAIQGDLDLLRVAFNNLLVNAVQAMAGVGVVTLSADRDAAGRIAIGVADTGPGVPADVRERIFEPFYTTKLRGTGLGLPTARRFIEAHGGTIDLLDRPGGGTIARVMLPAAD